MNYLNILGCCTGKERKNDNNKLRPSINKGNFDDSEFNDSLYDSVFSQKLSLEN